MLPVPANPVPAPNPLNDAEQAEYDRVLAHFTSVDTLADDERMWLSHECLLRYIRATKHDVDEAIKRLQDTLAWRRDVGVDTAITAAHVEPEALTGKQFLFGFDTRGRPALYMYPSRQNTAEGPRQIHFVVWVLERAVDLMGPGVETIALMIDYADKAKNPSLATARTVLNILQTHYPERLGAAVIAHLPWLLHAFYKLITPLIDPVTRAKMVFNPVPDDAGLWRSADRALPDAKLFELVQLVEDGWSGAAPFTYTHEVYWPALVAMAETRRKDMRRVWRELGAKVGIKEWDVKVAVRDGLTGQAL